MDWLIFEVPITTVFHHGNQTLYSIFSIQLKPLLRLKYHYVLPESDSEFHTNATTSFSGSEDDLDTCNSVHCRQYPMNMWPLSRPKWVWTLVTSYLDTVLIRGEDSYLMWILANQPDTLYYLIQEYHLIERSKPASIYHLNNSLSQC